MPENHAHKPVKADMSNPRETQPPYQCTRITCTCIHMGLKRACEDKSRAEAGHRSGALSIFHAH